MTPESYWSFADVIEQLKQKEGWREYVYDDATGQPIIKGSTVIGHPTIGWGFCVSADRGSPLPKAVAETWLRSIVEESARQVRAAFPWAIQTLNPVRYRVLVEMVFQLGVHGVLEFKDFLAFAEDGQYERAAEAMLDSRWASQTPKRAQRLAKIFKLGKDA